MQARRSVPHLRPHGIHLCRLSGAGGLALRPLAQLSNAAFLFPAYDGKTLPRGDDLQLPYIDDLNSMGCFADGVNAVTACTQDAQLDARLPT